MSRKKKNRKKKSRKNNNRSSSGGGGQKTVTEKAETTGDAAPEKATDPAPTKTESPASKPASEAAPAPSTATAVAEPLSLDAPMDQWPVLQDRGTDPIKMDYDHGGVPLFLLMFYLAFLGLTFSYIASWLIPDYLAYFTG